MSEHFTKCLSDKDVVCMILEHAPDNVQRVAEIYLETPCFWAKKIVEERVLRGRALQAAVALGIMQEQGKDEPKLLALSDVMDGWQRERHSICARTVQTGLVDSDCGLTTLGKAVQSYLNKVRAREAVRHSTCSIGAAFDNTVSMSACTPNVRCTLQ